VNRLAGERGPCGAGLESRFFSLQTEVSDELELIPTFAITFSGCDLRCPFCITAPPSWQADLGQRLSAAEVAHRAMQALEQGARTIMFLGGEPTIHLATVLDVISLLPDSARLIWKTNGRCTAEARRWLEGLIEGWVVDFKFGNPDCSRRLVGDSGYMTAVQETLVWAAEHSDLVVRHLVMPGHVACCWQPVAAWLAERLPGVKVNLRTGFWPARMMAGFPELQRFVEPEEAQQASRIATQYQLRLIS